MIISWWFVFILRHLVFWHRKNTVTGTVQRSLPCSRSVLKRLGNWIAQYGVEFTRNNVVASGDVWIYIMCMYLFRMPFLQISMSIILLFHVSWRTASFSFLDVFIVRTFFSIFDLKPFAFHVSWRLAIFRRIYFAYRFWKCQRQPFCISCVMSSWLVEYNFEFSPLE